MGNVIHKRGLSASGVDAEEGSWGLWKFSGPPWTDIHDNLEMGLGNRKRVSCLQL